MGGLILNDDKSANLVTLVFLIVFLGSLTVTLNTKLLGGTVSILQSICVLGYCLGPLVLSLPIVKIINHLFSVGKMIRMIKLGMVVLAMVWSCRAAMRFMVSSVDASRKVLAVYPICFVLWDNCLDGYDSVGYSVTVCGLWCAIIRKTGEIKIN